MCTSCCGSACTKPNGKVGGARPRKGTAILMLQKLGQGQVHKENCGGPLSCANGLCVRMFAIGRSCFTPASASRLTSGICVAADVLAEAIHDRWARTILAKAFGNTAFPSRRGAECLCCNDCCCFCCGRCWCRLVAKGWGCSFCLCYGASCDGRSTSAVHRILVRKGNWLPHKRLAWYVPSPPPLQVRPPSLPDLWPPTRLPPEPWRRWPPFRLDVLSPWRGPHRPLPCARFPWPLKCLPRSA